MFTVQASLPFNNRSNKTGTDSNKNGTGLDRRAGDGSTRGFPHFLSRGFLNANFPLHPCVDDGFYTTYKKILFDF